MYAMYLCTSAEMVWLMIWSNGYSNMIVSCYRNMFVGEWQCKIDVIYDMECNYVVIYKVNVLQ